MPKLDLTDQPFVGGSTYPGKLAATVKGRSVQTIGDLGGLTQYGVNIVHLEPGAISSLRHYQMEQDEFVIVLSGTCLLIDDQGEHDGERQGAGREHRVGEDADVEQRRDLAALPGDEADQGKDTHEGRLISSVKYY